MRKAIGVVLALGLLPAAGAGQSFGSSAKGTTAAEFLELGVGGRAMGMGGAYTAVADDATSLYWNPAGLTNIEHRAATFMHAAYLQSSFYDYAAYAQNLGHYGAFGASVQYLNAGSIAQTDANFNTTGSFTPNDLALSAGYGYKLNGLGPLLDGAALGASVKYIHSAIVNTAQTLAVDAGALSPEYLDGKLRFGFAMSNLGGTLKYQQTAENLPLTFKVGGLYHVTPYWLTSLDVGLPRDNGPYFAAGSEYLFPIRDSWSLAGRLGYNSQTLYDVTGITGFSLGLGIGSKRLAFDCAFAPYGGVGITNRVSVSVKL